MEILKIENLGCGGCDPSGRRASGAGTQRAAVEFLSGAGVGGAGACRPGTESSRKQ